jgi:hypothetical protein
MKAERLVIDSNVWIAALLSPAGTARRLVDTLLDHEIDILMSEIEADYLDLGLRIVPGGLVEAQPGADRIDVGRRIVTVLIDPAKQPHPGVAGGADASNSSRPCLYTCVESVVA